MTNKQQYTILLAERNLPLSLADILEKCESEQEAFKLIDYFSNEYEKAIDTVKDKLISIDRETYKKILSYILDDEIKEKILKTKE